MNAFALLPSKNLAILLPLSLVASTRELIEECLVEGSELRAAQFLIEWAELLSCPLSICQHCFSIFRRGRILTPRIDPAAPRRGSVASGSPCIEA